MGESMTSSWYKNAVDISQRFDAYIIPLISKKQPYSKLNLTKWANEGLPEDRLPSKDPKQIEQWANRFSGYGVVPAKNFLILDVDVKKDQDGKRSFKFLKERGLPTDTFVVKSPSGGLHLYYHKPAHYTPSTSVGATLQFDDKTDQLDWLDLRDSTDKSSGLDTRYCWAYCVGPGSKFKDDLPYEVLRDRDLAYIPSSITIGAVSNVTTKRDIGLDVTSLDIAPGSIKNDRNNHVRDLTYKLSLKRLSDDRAFEILKKYVTFYNDHDGEAPTFDIIMDMYNRAKEKVSDIVTHLLATKAYVIVGERVIDRINPSNVLTFKEFKAQHANQLIPLEISKPDGSTQVKMMNPVDVWHGDPERITVRDIVFDIRQPYGEVTVERDDDVPHFNLFRPPTLLNVSDYTETQLGVRIFKACVDVFENVVSSQYDLMWFKKWVGVMFFDPTFRPAWHWHIFSKNRGIGKDTIANILRTMYGQSNVKNIGIDSFTDKTNTEIFTAGLAVLSDFQAVSNQGKHSAVNAAFKNYTGTTHGRMRALYKDGTQAVLSVRFLMLSNSYGDFPVDTNDRRLFKCESEGTTLDRDTYTLANILINPDDIQSIELKRLGFDRVSDEDVKYATSLLFDYFKRSDWEDMYETRDCPENTIKDDMIELSEPKYVTNFRDFILHRRFVFSVDVITEDSISAMLEYLKVSTKAATVLNELVERGVVHRIVSNNNQGKPVIKRINVPQLEFDHELNEIFFQGIEVRKKCYAVRNVQHWCNPGKKNKERVQVKREYMRLKGAKNILSGIDAKPDLSIV